MSEIIKQFLELDTWLNENYNNISNEEYQVKVRELNDLCDIIKGEN